MIKRSLRCSNLPYLNSCFRKGAHSWLSEEKTISSSAAANIGTGIHLGIQKVLEHQMDISTKTWDGEWKDDAAVAQDYMRGALDEHFFKLKGEPLFGNKDWNDIENIVVNKVNDMFFYGKNIIRHTLEELKFDDQLVMVPTEERSRLVELSNISFNLTGTADLLIVDRERPQDILGIVDFKTGRDWNGHQLQLAGYAYVYEMLDIDEKVLAIAHIKPLGEDPVKFYEFSMNEDIMAMIQTLWRQIENNAEMLNEEFIDHLPANPMDRWCGKFCAYSKQCSLMQLMW